RARLPARIRATARRHRPDPSRSTHVQLDRVVTAADFGLTRRSGPACEAVLMDLDGTLVFSEDVHRRAWQAFFDTWSVAVTDADYEQHYMGRRPSDVIAGVPGPWTGTDAAAAL